LWDNAGTTVAGATYANTGAWFMRFDGGQAVDGVTFYDSIASNRLWHDVSPAK
jgi:ketosteroid isomerase-like protein